MSLKNMTEEEKKVRKRKQKAEAQKRYYKKNKEYYKNYSKNWSIQKQKEKDKEIERLNNIIKIKNNRIQQLINRTRNARIDKAIERLQDYDLVEDKQKVIDDVFDILRGVDKGDDKE